jgi:energy-coupling factor transporter ATP-binding protein EcfA2
MANPRGSGSIKITRTEIGGDMANLYPTIRGVHLKNFRVFEDTQFELGSLTVFVGMNGSGKSSLARAISLIPWTVHGGLRSTISRIGGGIPLFRLDSTELSIDIGYTIYTKDDEFYGVVDHSIKLNRDVNSSEGYRVGKEVVDIYDKDEVNIASCESIQSKRSLDMIQQNLLSLRGNIKDSQINMKPGQVLARNNELPSLLWHDLELVPQFFSIYGKGTAFIRVDPTSTNLFRRDGRDNGWLEQESNIMWTFIYNLCQLSDKSSIKKRWMRNIQRFLPWISNIIGHRDVNGSIRIIIQEDSGARYHPFDVSDGTLMLLGHLSMIESGGTTIIVDEPETHLHPDAIDSLMKLYRDMIEDKTSPIKQIIITTQSPIVVRNCRPEEIRVVQRTGSRSEVLEIAEDPNILGTHLQRAGMTLDEAWLANVFGGTTSPLDNMIGK